MENTITTTSTNNTANAADDTAQTELRSCRLQEGAKL